MINAIDAVKNNGRNLAQILSFSAVKWLSYLSLDPRYSSSNPAEDDGFLRAIKINSTTFFGGE
jgi:hypothetical protein